MVTAHASIGSQNCWSKPPRAMSNSRGNGCGSVLHSMAVNCWTISAKASVEST